MAQDHTRAFLVCLGMSLSASFVLDASASDKPLPNTLGKLAVACESHGERPAAEFRQSLVSARTAKPGWRVFLDEGTPAQKSAAATWLAGRLGLTLHRVDLATVTSKYIGETEKNLSNLFERAERQDWVLFFDEADALFGRRTEVSDAHDRYANESTDYVLQRLERYEGLVILASNRPVPPALRGKMAKHAHAVVPLGPDKKISWPRVCRPAKK